MSTGWNVYVSPHDNKAAREWVTRANDAHEAGDFVKYLDPKLPQGMKASADWDTRPADCPTFDVSRLRETPREWKEEE